MVLTILLLTLKLTGVINPSWLLVFLPLIVGVGIPVLFVLVAMIIIGTIAGFTVFLALASGKK